MKKWAKKYDKCLECGSVKRKHLSYGFCARCYWVKRRQKKLPQHKWARDYFCCVKCGKTDSVFTGKGICARCRSEIKRRKEGKLQKGGWAFAFDKCIKCGTIARPHLAKGLCDRCYNRRHREKMGIVSHKEYRELCKWSRRYDKCVKCGAAQKKHSGNGLCRTCYFQKNKEKTYESRERGRRRFLNKAENGVCESCSKNKKLTHKNRTMCASCYTVFARKNREKWAKKFDQCVVCNSFDKFHVAKGLCVCCYLKKARKENPEKMSRWRKTSYKRNIAKIKKYYGLVNWGSFADIRLKMLEIEKQYKNKKGGRNEEKSKGDIRSDVRRIHELLLEVITKSNKQRVNAH